ncbi:Uncharacterised protein [Mycobacteroides abscessus subsp. abscessus]|nr:Uncharacterised protein [Mycobacteroides abscessus subsp. abscessus]
MVAVLGWFAPWFGIPLALFVIVDAVWGIVASRRGSGTPPHGSEHGPSDEQPATAATESAR